MTITFGPAAGVYFITEDGPTDLTPYVTDVSLEPDTTYRLEGRLDFGRPRRVSWSAKVEIEPRFWRRVTGKAHPRISRMHSRYPRRWRKKR